MWTARASPLPNQPFGEVIFLSGGKTYRATAQGRGFDDLEVYVRNLGKRPAKPGWSCRVPDRVRQLTGWMRRDERLGGDLLRLLEITDPKGRKALLEFANGAPPELLDVLRSELFTKEVDDGQERKLQDPPGARERRDSDDGVRRDHEGHQEDRGAPVRRPTGQLRELPGWFEKLRQEEVLA